MIASETLRGSNAATIPAAEASGPASKPVEVGGGAGAHQAGGTAGAEDELPPAPWSPAWFICMYRISIYLYIYLNILHCNIEIQFATNGSRRTRAMNLMQQYMSSFNIVTKQWQAVNLLTFLRLKIQAPYPNQLKPLVLGQKLQHCWAACFHLELNPKNPKNHEPVEVRKAVLNPAAGYEQLWARPSKCHPHLLRDPSQEGF